MAAKKPKPNPFAKLKAPPFGAKPKPGAKKPTAKKSNPFAKKK